MTIADIDKHIKALERKMKMDKNHMIALKRRKLRMLTNLEPGDIVVDVFGTIGIVDYSHHDPSRWEWRQYDPKHDKVLVYYRYAPAELSKYIGTVTNAMRVTAAQIKGECKK